MRKTITVLLLALGLLLSCVCGAQAGALSRADLYAALLQELHCYFDGDGSMLPEDLSAGFEELGAYKKSAAFSYYTAVLRDVEAGAYGRISMLLDWMRIDQAFSTLLAEEGFPAIDELEQYANGRQAEAMGDSSTAIACYRKAVSLPDSLIRIARLDSADLETQYQSAIALLGTAGQTLSGYERAVELLTVLAERNYRNSAALLHEAQARLAVCVLQTAPPQRAANAVLVTEGYRPDSSDFTIDIYSDGTCTIGGYHGASPDVYIPAMLYGYRVTEIGKAAFQLHTDLRTVVIPEGVDRISDSAFCFCFQLQSVTLPKTLQHIGEGAFQQCKALTAIDLPAGLRHIGSFAFFFCDLTSVTIPSAVSYIGANPFQHCMDLREIVVEPFNQDYYIENHALMSRSGCLIAYPGSGPVTFRMPDSVTTIGDRAFIGCVTLVQIELSPEQSRLYRNPRGFLLDGDDTLLFAASAKALGVTDYVIPTGTRTLPPFTLHSDQQIRSVVIPEGVTSIGGACFYECPQLKRVTLPRSVTDIHENCFKLDNERLLLVPEGSYAHQFLIEKGHHCQTY